MIKLLAVDMDGTCLDDRSRLSDETLEALEKAAEAGILLVPTTGRAYACIPHRLKEQKDLYRYVITSNGAKVLDLNNRKIIFRAEIPKSTTEALLRDMKERSIGVGVITHINNQYILQGRALYFVGRMIYGKDARNTFCVRDMEQFIRKSRYDTEEIQFYFLSGNAREETERILAGYPELQGAYTDQYVEIFSGEATKGRALKALADWLGIKKEETACIGDGENDLYMFREAGLKFAMGNAVPQLKAEADVILPSNNQNGVAMAVKKIMVMNQYR